MSHICFTAKDLATPDDYSEVHFDQLLQAKNIEAIYEEFLVTAFFATEGCNDPRVLQDEALEGTPLGTLANYRAKVLDAAMCFIACNQKWMAFHSGPLVQSFPKQIPPRKYLSHKLAQALKLPYTCAEAFQKFKKLLSQCKEDWEVDDKVHGEQMKICREILELGAYVLPGEVIASEKMKDFVCKCLQKELLLCIKKIRQGKLGFNIKYVDCIWIIINYRIGLQKAMCGGPLHFEYICKNIRRILAVHNVCIEQNKCNDLYYSDRTSGGFSQIACKKWKCRSVHGKFYNENCNKERD